MLATAVCWRRRCIPRACPAPGAAGKRFAVHRKNRALILDYCCGDCRRVFNAFTGTVFQKTSRLPSTLILISRGIAQGTSTARLARELGCDRMKLLELRHKIQDLALVGLDPTPLSDPMIEVDECYVNAGEKKVSRIASRMIRHEVGPTSDAATAHSKATARRSRP